ncbi:MAG TPA: Tol-Pal system beta propeller repeat protein TolB [Sphingomicrobium sp.]|nr:Tol-Pal system beta propeller repeat protein TolB [Sphingomicrobium sp.]
MVRAGLFALLASAALGGTAVAAVQAGMPAATVIAIPPLTSPDSGTKGNQSLAIAWQATQLIETDLRQTSELMPLKPNQKDYYSYPEVTAPTFSKWRERGAKALITGFVQQRSDGRLTVGCYVYDVDKGRELGRIGFVATPSDLRRAAHKCSGLAYQSITGAPGMFDTRIAYVAETGPSEARVKRIAIMDSDGYNHSYVTSGGTGVLTPRLSPNASKLAYVSFQGGVPQVRIIDLASNQQHPLLSGNAMSFAPRFSPDGSQIVFSMMLGPNTDIYVVGANGGPARRLTTAPGIDTDPSFSPDGSKIVFESDRSGTQQLYVMNSDGSDERRITFSIAAYSTPEWSPDGKSIAFTWRSGDTRRIGVIAPDGTGEKILTGGPGDEAPSWAASSQELVFQHAEANGRPGIYRVSLDGSAPRKMTIPQDGSDPDWSGAVD